MPRLIGSAETIDAVGNKHKVCDEYVGLINTGDENVSITRMHSPSGWEGMGHYSDFHEYAVALKGRLHVEHTDGTMDVETGQAVHIKPRRGSNLLNAGRGGLRVFDRLCSSLLARGRPFSEMREALAGRSVLAGGRSC
jgi:mannose-6-phosphate isomerase-like protein (cupin superfamily)